MGVKSVLRRILGRDSGEPAKLLEPGAAAPDFSVTAHDGSTVRLRDLRGRTVVLWFFPKADTPGCTTQGCGLRDRHPDFEPLGAVILGASFDPPAANRAFAEKFGYPFLLLCDTDRSLGLAYGACDRPDAGHARRITYVIDPQGRIAHVLPKVDPATHTALVLSLLGRAA